MNKIEEIKEIAIYLEGMAAGTQGDRQSVKLEKAADWLNKLARHICGQGYIGCFGGDKCSSDHK